MPVFSVFYAVELCISENARYERQDLLISKYLSENSPF